MAVIAREACGGEAHRCDRAMTARSGNLKRLLIAERWPGGSARHSVVYGAESAASEQRLPEGITEKMPIRNEC